MKKWKIRISEIIFLVFLFTGSLAAEETPKQILKQGEECLRLLLEGNLMAASLYDEKAGAFINDSFISKSNIFIPVIEELLKKYNITASKSISYFTHNERKGMEVGYFLNAKDQETILYATGWSLQDNKWQKDFEFITPLKQSPKFVDVFDSSRKRWVTLCNQHDPAALTSEMYLSNAIYFSYGEMTSGPGDIAERYSYMSRPDYTLDLQAKLTFPFDDMHGMEVGKYINARNEGVYIILWKKVDDAWKIMLDFNF